jgi:CBS-domain-containing membrane protein
MRFTDGKGTFKKNREYYLDLGRSAAGASIAIALALWFVGRHEGPFLLASLGGSTVFLFALRDTEAAQPRALFGGHLGGALIGILCFQIFGDALWVSAAAVALTMVWMVATRTIHPPAGANPLLMVHNHAGFDALLNPVGIAVLTLFVTAMLWSRLGRGKKYPVKLG